MKKAKYFITCNELTSQLSQPIIGINELHPERLRPLLISKAQQKRAAEEQQLTLDFKEEWSAEPTPDQSWCKGIMPKFNTSEWGILGKEWEGEEGRSKQKGSSQQGNMLLGYGKLAA